LVLNKININNMHGAKVKILLFHLSFPKNMPIYTKFSINFIPLEDILMP
jgi:hypothetical protein